MAKQPTNPNAYSNGTAPHPRHSEPNTHDLTASSRRRRVHRALALRIQGGAVTTVASFAQLGVPTPVTPSQPLVVGQPPWKPQLPELEPVVTSFKLAALASMSGLREPRVDLPACSRSSLSKPDDGRGGAAAAGTVAPGSPQRPADDHDAGLRLLDTDAAASSRRRAGS